MHPIASHVLVDGAEVTGRKTKLIAPNSERDDIWRTQLHGDLRDFHRRAGAPRPHGVEYPLEANAGDWQSSVPKSAKIRCSELVAPEHNSNVEGAVVVQNVLRP